MRYRKFGSTGFDISALGYGCMRLPEYQKDGIWYMREEESEALLLKAVELGINYFDSAYYYCHQNSERMMGKALRHVRDKIKLSTKLPVSDDVINGTNGGLRKMLDESLRRMNTDYVDYYHMWGIGKGDIDRMLPAGVLKEALKAKDEGLIKHISFSTHDTPDNIKYIIDRGEVFESVLCQYNLLDRKNEPAIAYAASKGLGVTVMGPLAGGRLGGPGIVYEKLTGKKSSGSHELGLRFVLGNPNVSCALSGMETISDIEQNASAVSSEEPFSEKERESAVELMRELKEFSELYCTGCNYCNGCPQKINIPHVLSHHTMYHVYGLTEGAKASYIDYLSWEAPMPGDCVDCGLCEEKCPQKLEIRKLIKQIDEFMRGLLNSK